MLLHIQYAHAPIVYTTLPYEAAVFLIAFLGEFAYVRYRELFVDLKYDACRVNKGSSGTIEGKYNRLALYKGTLSSMTAIAVIGCTRART